MLQKEFIAIALLISWLSIYIAANNNFKFVNFIYPSALILYTGRSTSVLSFLY